MKKILNNDWQDLLEEEFNKDYYLALRSFLTKEYKENTIYPDKYDIFNALHFTPYKDVKVVILGQDPYHGPNQAHGLSFSVNPNVAIPPSLLNIYKELKSDLGCYIPNNGYLKKWAEQGVLLLNTSLTVRASQANSHKNIGWEIFTDKIISLVNEKEYTSFLDWKNQYSENDYTTQSNLQIQCISYQTTNSILSRFRTKVFYNLWKHKDSE